MSRPGRLHIAGGTYYIVQSGSTRGAIFRCRDDYVRFERLLRAALHRTSSRLHAYCWLADSIHMAVEIDAVPVGRLMQSLTSQFARATQARCAERGHFFRHRHRAILIDPHEQLLPLVRYLHHLPVIHGHASSPADHACSSDFAYRGARAPYWLTTARVERAIEHTQPRIDYASYVALAPSTIERQLFENGGGEDPRIVGGRDFVATLPRPVRPYRTTATVDQVIETVACRLGIQRERILSASRERELTLARALVAWYVTERRIASLAGIARRLRRDSSTLSVGIARYRRRRPDLFDVQALHDLAPLVPLSRLVEMTHRTRGVAVTGAPA